MEAHKSTVLIIAILIGLSLFSTLSLETRLSHWVAFEMLVILVALFFSASILFGLWLEESWAYALTTIFFSLAIANLLWMFLSTKTFFVFVFGILVNVAGLVMCLSSTETPVEYTPRVDLETYDIEEARKDFEAFKKRRGKQTKEK